MRHRSAIVFGYVLALSFFVVPFAHAFDSVVWSVQNTSQNNADALQDGAYPGDVLRFDIDVTPVDGPEDFLLVDVTQIIDKSRIIDKGFGDLSGNELSYPVFDGSEMTFFVRVNQDCTTADPTLMATADGESVSVNLFCLESGATEPSGGGSNEPREVVETPPMEELNTSDVLLPSTGTSSQNIIMSVIGIVLFGAIALGSLYVSKKD